MDARFPHSGIESIYLTEEHVALRDQAARFLAKEVEPHGEAWEEQGRVPAENLLGEENAGFYAVMKNFQTERIAAAAIAVGHALTALRLTVEYVKSRKAFGGVLFDKQVIRQRLAMLEAKTRAARQFLYHCGWLATQRRDYVREVSMRFAPD